MKDFTTISLFKIPGFYLKGVSFSSDLKEINFFVKQRRKTADCPFCFKRTRFLYGHRKERKVLHRLLGNQRIYLSFNPRRFKCQKCQKVFVESFSFLRKKSRQTEDLLSDLLYELRTQCFSTIKEKTGVGYQALRKYLLRRLSPFLSNWEEEENQEKISLGIDEHHFKKQRFVTTITNLTSRRLKTILPSDRKSQVMDYLKSLPLKIKEKIIEVCCDMDSGYIRAVYETLPYASLVIDPFHVIQDANRRLNEARILEQEATGKKLNWKVFLKGKEHLNRQREEDKLLEKYLKSYPYLNTFYHYKEALREMYKLKTKKEAEEKLTQMIILMKATDIIELKQWAKTLNNYKKEILNHFDNRTTNGYTEGLNVKLKMIQRVSFGFRNLDVYIRKAMLAILPLALIYNTY
jgi:transposase